MKRLRFEKFGGTENLYIDETTLPEPGEDEVLVRVLAASVNPSDVKNVQGRMVGTTLPRTPGRDFAGVVVGGPKPLIGQEIWGTGGDLGFTQDGTHAEAVVIPAAAVSLKPSVLSSAEAACVGTAFCTAFSGLIDRARLQRGETVLVTGAAGAVGSAVLQLGHASGAKLIAVDRKPFDTAAYAGVDLLGHIDNSRQEIGSSVQALTAGHGIDVAFDCVGGELFEPVLSTLGHGGRQIAMTSVGTRRVSFDLLDFYHRRLSLYGVDSRAFSVVDCARMLDGMRPMFESGSLKGPSIGKTGPLESFLELYSHVDSGGSGKAVFQLG